MRTAWSTRRSFTAGTGWLLPRELTPSGRRESSIHEAGHQWWYGIVGNNEFEDAWLDEGINTFATARAMDQEYPPDLLRTALLRQFRAVGVPGRVASARNRREPAPGLPAGRRERRSVRSGFSFQPRVGTLHHVQQDRVVAEHAGAPARLGDAATHLSRRSMRAGSSSIRSRRTSSTSPTKSPAPDLDWFFDQVYRSSNVFDYGVEDLKSVEEDRRFRTTVVVRRYGEAIFPVDVRRHLQGRHADPGALGRPRPVDAVHLRRRVAGGSAQVDPERVLLLDVDYTNNSKSLVPNGRSAATKWSLKWMIWLQDALLSWAFLV